MFLERDPVYFSKKYVKVMKFTDYAEDKGSRRNDKGIDIVAEKSNGTDDATQG